MKVLSLLSPWAGLVVLGTKQFETRSWRTKYRGHLGIHASASMTKEGKALLDWLSKNHKDFKEGSYNYDICTRRAAIIGSVELVDVHSTNASPVAISDLEGRLGNFDPNRFFWEMKNPVVFDTPIMAKGALNIWNYESGKGY